MNTGFPLPKSAARAHFTLHAATFMVGTVIAALYLYGQGKDPVLIAICIAFAFILEAGMYIWMRRYKYVFLSASGIKGRSKNSTNWETIAWQDAISSKQTTFNRLKGKY